MKLGTCRFQGEQYVFIDVATHLFLPALQPDLAGLPPENPYSQQVWRDMLCFIEHYAEVKPALQRALANPNPAAQIAYEAVEILAPIPRPRKNVMCLGLNYLEHAEETANQIGRSAKAPEYPIVFTKSPSSVIGPNAVIPFDAETCSNLDWEAELGVVLGKGGRKISQEQALSHIFGYTVINDISARDIQLNHKQYFLGKSVDGGCPMGPYIITADEIADPQNLAISCRVNGVTKQASNTRHMIFPIASIIQWLSRAMTLDVGDVIATGTPSGVGFVRQPPEFLLPGDVVECEVEHIGVLRNTVVA